MLDELMTLLGGQQGQMPDTPDNIILLNYAGGGRPSRSFKKKRADVRYPLIQVKVRNLSYFNAVAKCEEVIGKLDGYSSELIAKVVQSGELLPLGRDEKNRYNFAINFEITWVVVSEE